MSTEAWERGVDAYDSRLARERAQLERLQQAARDGRGLSQSRQLDLIEAAADGRSAPDAARAEDNQRHVRETLAARDPEYARKVNRAAREASPRAGRKSR